MKFYSFSKSSIISPSLKSSKPSRKSAPSLPLANSLTVDIFGVYLAAMGISEGFTKWFQSKKGTNNDTTIY